jgi:RNA polymerase sigma factor (sigma-70 family)
LLVVITLRKCGRVIRHFHGPFHDIRKEVSNQVDSDDSAARWEALAREPTPAEAAEMAETLRLVMAGLDARDRHILELRLLGHKAREIAEAVGLTEFTVQGVLKKIQTRLRRMRDEHVHAE